MVKTAKTFRVFVSSTFNDLIEERNALQRDVFPRLRQLCQEHGCRFQAIDLRWGVRKEAALDQQTVKICTEEIERCQHTELKPNFVVLLGDRYGWLPAPYEIKATLFEDILSSVSPSERALLSQWYRRDDNAVPAVFCLQTRTGVFVDDKMWEPVEGQLHSILETAAKGMPLNDAERLDFYGSATEQEIYHGALNVPDAGEHVFCLFRTIEGLPHDESGTDFTDVKPKEGVDTVDTVDTVDKEAQERLSALKAQLREKLSGNIYEYGAAWTGTGSTSDHLAQLCEDVYARLSRTIQQEIKKLKVLDPVDQEVNSHQTFGTERAAFFTGREGILQEIDAYVETNENDENGHVLAIHGSPGSGKTALMAEAAQRAVERYPEAVVAVRFVGATAPSTNVRSLLEFLCKEIERRFGGMNHPCQTSTIRS